MVWFAAIFQAWCTFMKILEPQSAVLSNFEVLAHINDLQARPRLSDKKLENAETVRKELSNYLAPHRSTTAVTSRSAVPNYEAPNYSAESMRELMARLKGYIYTPTKPEGLYKHEVLMIVNLRPSETSLLDCIIEECDERFTDEQQEDILRIVAEILGKDGDGMNGSQDEGRGDADFDRMES